MLAQSVFLMRRRLCSHGFLGIRRFHALESSSGSAMVPPPPPNPKSNRHYRLAEGSDEDAERITEMLHSWVDVREDSGFRGHFVSGKRREDLEALVQHYTAPALARALRDREETLAECAALIKENKIYQVRDLLAPFSELPVAQNSGQQHDEPLQLPDKEGGGLFHRKVLRRLRTRLNRMPREITKRARKRASVIVPLCHLKNEPSIFFTQRSDTLRRHKGEICFPGGMVDDSDTSIVDAGLRELEEETGVDARNVEVLGVLRCDWSELFSITGVAVTPIVSYLGELENLELKPNPGEVSNCFTIPVVDLLDQRFWTIQEFSTPVFRRPDDPKERTVWGLTGYILHRFMKILPSVVFENKGGISRSISFASRDHHDYEENV